MIRSRLFMLAAITLVVIIGIWSLLQPRHDFDRNDPAQVHAAWLAALTQHDSATVKLLYYTGAWWDGIQASSKIDQVSRYQQIGYRQFGKLVDVRAVTLVEISPRSIDGYSEWTFEHGVACYVTRMSRLDRGYTTGALWEAHRFGDQNSQPCADILAP